MIVNVKAYAKINLYLDITGQLPDGYHALSTVMQSVSLYDTLVLQTGSLQGITLTCDEKDVPTDERNTAFKAALRFYEALGVPPSVHIALQKAIPSFAGLGGGSADAAGVLQGLNILYGNALPTEVLMQCALKVGADVPFCMLGGTKLCLNKGEVMRALPDYECEILLAKPVSGISTKEAFEKFDSGIKLIHPDNAHIIRAFENGEGAGVLPDCLNVFEQLGTIEGGEAIKEVMRQSGAVHACLTGSGSTYFGCFKNKQQALLCKSRLERLNPDLFLCQCTTVNRGIDFFE